MATVNDITNWSITLELSITFLELSIIFPENSYSTGREYLRGKYHCTVDLLIDWFGISCMITDTFCFYLQNRLIQTSQQEVNGTMILPPLVFSGTGVPHDDHDVPIVICYSTGREQYLKEKAQYS
jgi:hypothetical protein